MFQRRIVRRGRIAAAGMLLVTLMVVTGYAEDGDNARRSPFQMIGMDRLAGLVGDRPMPTGRGVVTGHVEGPNGEYSPGTFDGVQIIHRSGRVSAWGKHARRTAMVLYGENGLARGVKEVHSFSGPNWLGKGYLNINSADPPNADQVQVFNHSWIHPGVAGAEDVLRRVDYAIDQRGVIMVVGVNNGRGTGVPALLGSAYNVIAVGAFGGNSSGGYTQFDGVGRCKPDIVGPMGQTSFSTPVVTGAVCMLLETAAGIPNGDEARKPQVIKAALMAGANKDQYWQPQRGRPLDEHQGAGLVRIDRSYQILTGGKFPPGRVRGLRGWDYATIEPGKAQEYRFDATDGFRQVTVALVWHRRIDGRVLRDSLTGQAHFVDIPRMANLDLQLISLDDAGESTTRADSASDVDNVELIHAKRLPPGRYRLIVSRRDKLDETWDYGLAWTLSPETSPEDTTQVTDNADTDVAIDP